MRSAVMILAAFGLAACGTAVPDSGAGVGFQDYDAYNAPAPVAAAPAAGFTPGGALAAIDKAEGKNTDTALTPTNQPLSAQAAASPYAAAAAGCGDLRGADQRRRIVRAAMRPQGSPRPRRRWRMCRDRRPMSARCRTSRTFQAVSAARNHRKRQGPDRAQPRAISGRSADGLAAARRAAMRRISCNIAISANHPKGTQMYKRGGLRLNSYNAACGKFPSPDLAQEAFLAAGGPDRDRKGLDPDGDGYACAWDPTPFRAAVQN